MKAEREAVFYLPRALSHGTERHLVIQEEDCTDPVGLRIREGFLEEEAVGWALEDE